jgi:hypothetical protein
MVGWVWAVQGVEEQHEWWALAGVDLGAVVVGLATLGALARAVTVRTGWYVVPYCLLTFAGAAHTWLLGTMYIRDAWF